MIEGGTASLHTRRDLRRQRSIALIVQRLADAGDGGWKVGSSGRNV
jgi:hypothetical protein